MTINQVFVPTVAEFPDDVKTSWDIQKPLADAGYKPGLMIVTRGGISGVSEPKKVGGQYSNLSLIKNYGNADIVTMLSNIPIGEIDFLHNPNVAKNYVIAGVNFARELPVGGRKFVTFHLNSLVDEVEFSGKSKQGWMEDFKRTILPCLEYVEKYARKNGVKVAVETVPVPEFGDLDKDDKRKYRGSELRNLRNPFYMLQGNEVIRRVRESGLGLCLDLCHNRTIYLEGNNEYPALFADDAERIKGGLGLQGEIESLIPERDFVHLNDGSGKYTLQGGKFNEGIALGEGDIKELPDIVRTINSKGIPFVLEINENDFANRPNTNKSIDYVLRHTKP